jgi:hypothetical protein
MSMQKWEYRLVIVKFENAKNDLADLNRAGSQGWEAVGWSESKTSFSILMKRPLSD